MLINGRDVSTIPLSKLRGQMVSTVLQDSVLFDASLRENLDPRCSYSDEEIWRALEMVGISETVQAWPSKLEERSRLTSSLCLSSGQRQLLCLARMLLTQPQIVILDEATAHIASPDDAKLHQKLLQALPNTTFITIAHRLDIVFLYDRVLVIEEGQLVEQGTPQELSSHQNSHFNRLLKP